MASYLFNDSSSSSEHDDFDYFTPVGKNPVYRKLIVDHELVDVESYKCKKKLNMDEGNSNGGEKNDEGNNNGGKKDYDNNDGGGKKDYDNNIGGEKKDDGYMGKGKEKIIDIDGDNEDGFGKYDDVDDEFLKSNINNVVPFVGKIFNTLDEAEKFYRDYGRSVGFEIIIRTTHRHSRGNGISSRLYICRKGGRLGSTPLDFENGVKGKRVRDVIPRTNCNARMCVVHRVKTNKWEVTLVELNHDHGMVSPDKVQFMQRSRNIDPITRSLIELFNKSGIETSKLMKYLSETCGGVEKLGFSNQDIRNVIRDIRHKVFDGGDAESGLVLLRELKENSFGKFFYRVDVDDENRVKGLVWVDPRSMNAYKIFGDVVTFDSTYRTNRYCMPFVPITGVNHHYQNILFGFALLRDEKETSYKWVLKTWLEAVDNIPPITIITDQDIALGNAIADVMPNTKHLYCSWHISNKFPEKLSNLYTTYPDFKADFNACIYKSLSPTEFIGRWEDLVDKYQLENHVWLNEMHGIRGQWIRAYTKQHFAAGMTTTSRSESMNSFFDEYVQASTGLKEFIENSQKALETQYLNEALADYETEYKQRRLILKSGLEIHASNIYTKEMFKRFQTELLKSSSFIVKRCKESGSHMVKWYLVENYTVPEHCRRSYRLTIPIDEMIECTCKKFEHSGMICRHMIRFFDKKQKTMIPPNYISLRWTKNANKIEGTPPYKPSVLVDVGESKTARYSALCKSFQSLGAIGSCSKPRMHYVMDLIERGKCYVNKNFPEEESDEKMNESFHQDGEHDPVLDPPMSQTKGRNKASRYKSGIETSTSKVKPRKCGSCGEEGAKHDRRNCPNKPT